MDLADAENYVQNDDTTLRKFNYLRKQLGEAPVKKTTLNRWFTNLTKLELLRRKRKKRIEYQVNPVFAYHGKDKKDDPRIKLIRRNLELPVRWIAAKFRALQFLEKDQP